MDIFGHKSRIDDLEKKLLETERECDDYRSLSAAL